MSAADNGGEHGTELGSVLLQPRPTPPTAPRRQRHRSTVIVLVALFVVLTALGAGLVWRSAPSVGHLAADPFADIPSADRATADPVAGTATNILLIGSDSRGPGSDIGQRSDVLMVVHLAADRQSASVISIPRDSWVPVPGYGTTKINAAFSYGGNALAVQTVEQLTGVRIDHVAVIDFQGFATITDALGGVQICSDGQTGDACPRMNGEQALAYVRERKSLPGGDFDRERRQQYWMRQVVSDVVHRDLVKDPVLLAKLVTDLSSSVQTDQGLGTGQLISLATSYSGVGGEKINFLQAPLANPATGYEGAASVVYLDAAAGAELWQAVRSDTVTDWVAQHPTAQLGQTVR